MSLSPSNEKFIEDTAVISVADQASLTQQACATIAIATLQKFCDLLGKCETVDEVKELIRKSIEGATPK